jgi:hypothetical protein
MKFVRQCTRYTNGNCTLTGYPCETKRNRNEKHSIVSVREICYYWFTRDVDEGKRIGKPNYKPHTTGILS